MIVQKIYSPSKSSSIPVTKIEFHCSDSVNVKVQAYQLYRTRRPTEDHEGLPQAVSVAPALQTPLAVSSNHLLEC